MPDLWWQGFTSAIVLVILLALIVLCFGSAIRAALSDARERKQAASEPVPVVEDEYVYSLNDDEKHELTVWCTYPGRADEVAREVALVRGEVREGQA